MKSNLIAFFVFVLSVSSANALADSIIIEGVTLIDGTGGPPLANSSVQIVDQRITRVIRGEFTEEEKDDAQVIDGSGKYLIPGMMDVHVHLGALVTKNGLRQDVNDFQPGIRALHSYLYSGVTTIFDVGNDPDYIFALRERERSGDLVAPRILATGGIVTYPGSHGSSDKATLVESWPQDRPLVDAHIARQPDIVKFTYEERGWGMRPMIPMLPLDLLQTLIEYYNDHGIRTTVHTAGERRARQALSAGVDSLAHPVIVGPVSDDFVQLMAVKRIPMASTLTIGENYSRLAEHPEFLDEPLYQDTVPQDEIEHLRTELRSRYLADQWTWWMKLMTPVAQENVFKINEAGGIIALGTDQTTGPAVHRELELLTGGGISSSDAIRIATLNAARLLGMEDELGSIHEGKIADLVLLNANPIDDIKNAREIHLVIKNGEIIDRTALELPVNNK